ncbi:MULTISPECIES: barstar family protein [unclassified Spirosoma]|uniref:barstar family protein n=1 Tax=unclassified Spirosoma TaxID=2621999 RepID=UPI00095962A4|nr:MULTISPECIES: barstar family protein [unclassified Spirosoma]MBN8823959.1 barstar family protein [Spirosoma sp.]OJW70372.1 MAG: barnase inhibitor [Spirosoma sp. 48-14]
MTPNVLISQSEKELEARFADDFIAHVDGKKATTLRQFYEEIADLLEIPDFGFSLDDLNDSLNDLRWLEDERIVLYFTNTADLISKERDPAKLRNVLSILEATAEDWKWTEDELDDKKEIVLVFEDSDRIRKLLEQEGIDYLEISKLK